MKTNVVKVEQILELLEGEVIGVYGNKENAFIDNLSDLDNVGETTLDWISYTKKDKQLIAIKTKAKILLVDESITYSEKLKSENKILIVVKNPKVSLAKIGNHFFIEKRKPFIHPTAIVHQEAIIGLNVSIGAYSVIDKCSIGDNTIIDSNVRIYDDTIIGSNCNIKHGAVLGGAGFGFEKDENGNLFRFPQIGSLIIGNYVEIGANTCIDRGALSDTIIGNYTKINNLCHIAHNNKIGKNVTVTAHVNISGSTIIGDDVWIAPNTSILGSLKLGKGATIGMGSVVTKDIPAGETWIGCPAKKIGS